MRVALGVVGLQADRARAARAPARGASRRPSPTCSGSSGSATMSPTRMRGFERRVRILEDDLHVAARSRAGRLPSSAADVRARRGTTSPGGRARSAAGSRGPSSTCRSRTRRPGPASRRASTSKRDVVDRVHRADLAPQQDPDRIGKCFFRPRTDSRSSAVGRRRARRVHQRPRSLLDHAGRLDGRTGVSSLVGERAR